MCWKIACINAQCGIARDPMGRETFPPEVCQAPRPVAPSTRQACAKQGPFSAKLVLRQFFGVVNSSIAAPSNSPKYPLYNINAGKDNETHPGTLDANVAGALATGRERGTRF